MDKQVSNTSPTNNRMSVYYYYVYGVELAEHEAEAAYHASLFLDDSIHMRLFTFIFLLHQNCSRQRFAYLTICRQNSANFRVIRVRQ